MRRAAWPARSAAWVLGAVLPATPLQSAAPPLPAPTDGARCARRPEAAGTLERLRQSLAGARFVAYQPTAIRFTDGVATQADEASIEADLRVLRPAFDALVTYGTGNGADRVGDVAARLGFRAVVLGIWNPADEREVALALAAARREPGVVLGFSLGNERVLAREATFATLARRITELSGRAPTRLWTTTEPFHLFATRDADPLLAAADFLLVNAHPAFQPWFPGAPDTNAAEFVVNVARDTAARFCGPLLVKETGVPTAPADRGFTPTRQKGFYAELRRQFPPGRDRAFAYFSAFDAAWRVADAHPVPGEQPQEGSWGLFDESRRPKPAARDLPPLPPR